MVVLGAPYVRFATTRVGAKKRILGWPDREDVFWHVKVKMEVTQV